MKIIITLIVLFIIVVVGAVLFINFGVYNVAATKSEPEIVKWVLQTTKDKSVRSRSKNIIAPNLDNESLIETGFHHYDQMCVGCHGAPGISPSEIGEGLNPEPPDLAEVAADKSPAELFWVTQNGISMTGMPAFGPTHNDDELWSIVAIMQKLPDLSPEEYMQMKLKAENMSHEHNHGDHSQEDGQDENLTEESTHQSEDPDVHIHEDGEEHEH